jgi:asparagine synthase (glutamine-hydrolysing)
MSGLCAVVHWDGRPGVEDTLERMAGAAAHRAREGVHPRVHGGVGLAHLARHLLPEDVPGGQPVTAAEEGLALVADCRLDNRDDLGRLLAAAGAPVPADAPDAAFILGAYRCWGSECPGKLLGDFAFVLFDARHRRLFAARDPMGMRPLFYRAEPHRLLLASEIKQILAAPGAPRDLHEPALAAHLTGVTGPQDWTCYAGIAQLPPACALMATPEASRTIRFWDIDPDRRVRYRDQRQYAEHLRELFLDAVRARLRSRMPVGIFLSGGLDSGSTAAAAGWWHATGRCGSRVRAYCWTFDELRECDERSVSDRLAHHSRLPVTYLRGDDAWPLADIPCHAPDPDEPYAWVYQALVERGLSAARDEGMGLVLTGDRGDELVGDWVFDQLGLLLAGRLRTLSADLVALRHWSGEGVAAAVRSRLIRPAIDPLVRTLFPWRADHVPIPLRYPPWIEPGFARRMDLEGIMRQSFPAPRLGGFARRRRYGRIFSFAGNRIARWRERIHARHGLGYADPWSDRRLAEFVLAIPQWVVQQVREPKAIARRAMEGIMPTDVLGAVQKTEPVALFDRGFRDRARERVFDLIRDSRSAARGYVREPALRETYEGFLRGEPQRFDFWWPLTLEMWLRAYWS